MQNGLRRRVGRGRSEAAALGPGRDVVRVDVNAESAPDVISNPQALSAALQALVQVGVLLARGRDGLRDC